MDGRKVSAMEDRLEHYLNLWHLTPEEAPLQTPTGLVAKVMWQNQPCILKISPEGGDEETASVLSHYDGQGAARLLQAEGRATLLERVIPGTHLSEFLIKGQDDQATHILCNVIEKLHSNQKFSGAYPTLEKLQEGFEKYLQSGDTQIPLALVKEAHFIYKKLVGSQETPILLHGDLHHDNVLYDEKRGWLAIDPKGYVGEPCYEVGAMLRNPLNCPPIAQNPERIRTRVSIICERLNFDRERVIGWAFSQAVLSGIWSVEDGESPEWSMGAAMAFKMSIKEIDFS
ncbi:MAG: phosphotransferase [Alphaproteobacteria bacterium]|nr:phosphotransferase [Alphaproteobacteria bacterium]